MVKSQIVEIHISNHREAKEMSQADLANRVGVVKQTIINLEKNKHNPSLMLMYAISKELGTTIEELVTFERLKNE